MRPKEISINKVNSMLTQFHQIADDIPAGYAVELDTLFRNFNNHEENKLDEYDMENLANQIEDLLEHCFYQFIG